MTIAKLWPKQLSLTSFSSFGRQGSMNLVGLFLPFHLFVLWIVHVS